VTFQCSTTVSGRGTSVQVKVVGSVTGAPSSGEQPSTAGPVAMGSLVPPPTTTAVTVASPGVSVVGSSLATSPVWVLVTVAWALTVVTPTGNGSSTTTSKAISVPAKVGTAPTSTATVGSPALPPVTVPRLVVTEPSTRLVLASGVSVKPTASSATLPSWSTVAE
jgi:hypothetical protein